MADIWELAEKERDAQRGGDAEGQPAGADTEATILVVGSATSGKTTAINRFLEKSVDSIKSTMALEYRYGRKSRANDMGKDVVHLWELGGGTQATELIRTVVTDKTITNVSVVIAVDLSKPAALWDTLETLLAAVRARVDKVLADLGPDSPVPRTLRAAARGRYGADHRDTDLVDPIAIPVVILGTMYDGFRDLEPSERKVICKAVRFLGHAAGAAVLFHSDADDALPAYAVGLCKSMFTRLGFGGGPPVNEIEFDSTKPLCIPAGGDSVKAIGQLDGLQVQEGTVRISGSSVLQLWREAYEKAIPPAAQAGAADGQPYPDEQHLEPAIDAMRRQKDDELEKYREKARRRARQLADRREQVTNAGVKPRKPAGSKSGGGARRGGRARRAAPASGAPESDAAGAEAAPPR